MRLISVDISSAMGEHYQMDLRGRHHLTDFNIRLENINRRIENDIDNIKLENKNRSNLDCWTHQMTEIGLNGIIPLTTSLLQAKWSGLAQGGTKDQYSHTYVDNKKVD